MCIPIRIVFMSQSGGCNEYCADAHEQYRNQHIQCAAVGTDICRVQWDSYVDQPVPIYIPVPCPRHLDGLVGDAMRDWRRAWTREEALDPWRNNARRLKSHILDLTAGPHIACYLDWQYQRLLTEHQQIIDYWLDQGTRLENLGGFPQVQVRDLHTAFNAEVTEATRFFCSNRLLVRTPLEYQSPQILDVFNNPYEDDGSEWRA